MNFKKFNFDQNNLKLERRKGLADPQTYSCLIHLIEIYVELKLDPIYDEQIIQALKLQMEIIERYNFAELVQNGLRFYKDVFKPKTKDFSFLRRSIEIIFSL